jgi:hypothetical protein
MDFGKGFTLGIAVAMTILVGMLAYELRDMASIYRDIGNIPLPVLTQLTISKAWLVGAPAAGLAASIGLFARRPRPLAPYVLLAFVMTVVALLTWFCPRLPIMQLAGSIKP